MYRSNTEFPLRVEFLGLDGNECVWRYISATVHFKNCYISFLIIFQKTLPHFAVAIYLKFIYSKPLNPRNARLNKLAATYSIGVPWKAAGTFEPFNLVLTPLITTILMMKPMAEPSA